MRVVNAASKATAQGPPERGSIAKRTEHRSSTDGSKEAKRLGYIDENAISYTQAVTNFATKLNIDKTIDNLSGSYEIYHEQFTYYLKILNIQDSIATAKITGRVLPFSYPEIGDKINLK